MQKQLVITLSFGGVEEGMNLSVSSSLGMQDDSVKPNYPVTYFLPPAQYDLCGFLADYIRPEDIPNFSCLCKAAYSITRTVSFWKNLYYR